MTHDDVTSGAGPRRSAPLGRRDKLGLLGETLVVGAAVAVVSIPLVTAVPAVAASVRHLRRHLLGEPDTLGALGREIVLAIRDLWWVGILLPVALLVLGFNLWAAAWVPGGDVVRVVIGAIAAALVVVVLRAAARWVPGAQPARLLADAARRSRSDPAGSALLVVALGVCGMLVWMLVPLLLVVGGLVVLAAVAVENRWDLRDVNLDEPGPAER
ncbi:hypothetical protein [Actinotalea sp. C106]|uniref:hypothetical protein n=1 Tax=Actinotalea sp. C106 TaxID=2908644 RepID=UPI00202859A5|nr:hypothetical protein [Actinotalea sp. C106]